MTSRPKFIAIVGGSGAGKTWLADRLQAALGKKASRLSLDDFYRDLSHFPLQRRVQINFDHPRAIDWGVLQKVLHDGLAGRPVWLPRYDFATHTRAPQRKRWRPTPLVLVEGLWLLRRPALRRLFALSIFLDASEMIRFRRRLKRDVTERGRTRASVREQFYGTVAPMHARFVAPQFRWADRIYGRSLNQRQCDALSDRLRRLLDR